MILSLAKFVNAAQSRRIDALARQVADLSLESVCQLVRGSVEPMRFAEARGYVRARAAQVVRKHARLAIHRHPQANIAWLDAVSIAAIDRMLPVVLRQTGVGVPRMATTLRAAA